MDEKEAKQVSMELMKTAEAACLSTIDDNGFPQTRVMGNLRNTEQYPGLTKLFSELNDDFLTYLTTSKSSAKMQQIRDNPKVSLYFCNCAEFHTLLLVGCAEEVTDQEFKKQLWQDGWEMYWPGGPNSDEYVVLKLLPDFAKGWYKEGAFEFKLK